VPVDDAHLAARRLPTTTVRQRCPACGSRFDRFEGNELIAIPLSFFLTVAVLLLTLFLLWMLGFVYPDGVPDKGRFTLPRR